MLNWLPWSDAGVVAAGCGGTTVALRHRYRGKLRGVSTWTRELALMFALSPATRFGYFAYPAGLYGFLALTGQATSPGRLVPLTRAAADSVRSWLSRRALLGEQAQT